MTGLYSRRKFLNRCFRTAIFGGGLTVEACRAKKSTSEEKIITSCEDVSGISEPELEKRKILAYIKQAPDSSKQCSGCKLYLPPKPGEMCGGCSLFKGPVDAQGSCTYWAPLE